MARRIVNPRADFTSPAEDYVTISPSDTTNFVDGTCRGIYVGVTGNIAVVNEIGSVVTFSNVPVGIFPVRAIRVNSTNTTATMLVALY